MRYKSKSFQKELGKRDTKRKKKKSFFLSKERKGIKYYVYFAVSPEQTYVPSSSEKKIILAFKFPKDGEWINEWDGETKDPISPDNIYIYSKENDKKCFTPLLGGKCIYNLRNMVFHATPQYRLNNIRKLGLIPDGGRKLLSYKK